MQLGIEWLKSKLPDDPGMVGHGVNKHRAMSQGLWLWTATLSCATGDLLPPALHHSDSKLIICSDKAVPMGVAYLCFSQNETMRQFILKHINTTA